MHESTTENSGTSSLRQLLDKNELIVAPGAYDCLTARAIELGGYGAAYMTGAGVSASHGFPDYGLLTMTEMVTVAERIARSLSIPLIADGDTGFGNELNTARTVRAYERAGVAAIQLEDQVFPKRCGHFEGKALIPEDDFIAKIKAAHAARDSADFQIIARTDARAVDGFEAAITRVKRALDAGADIAFVEAPQTLSEVEDIPRLVDGPCLLNIVWRGKTPDITYAQAQEMGYRILILPSLLLKSVMGMSESIVQQSVTLGRHPVPPGDIDLADGVRRAGGVEWSALEASTQ